MYGCLANACGILVLAAVPAVVCYILYLSSECIGCIAVLVSSALGLEKAGVTVSTPTLQPGCRANTTTTGTCCLGFNAVVITTRRSVLEVENNDMCACMSPPRRIGMLIKCIS